MCCCCPPAITALFCLWVQSGFSKGTVAGALTFFPPEPALYQFERRDKDGNPITDENTSSSAVANDHHADKADLELRSSTGTDDDVGEVEGPAPGIQPVETREKTEANMKSPAQQFTERAKMLKQRAKRRNIQDAQDSKNGVTYKFVLDPRIVAPPSQGSLMEALKIASASGSHVATLVYHVPPQRKTADVKTLIFSHGNATDIGAMFPLQAVMVHNLNCNVVMYDYSGYGESGGCALESSTYTDIEAVYSYCLEHLAANDPSRIVLYGQSVGSGPCCHLTCKEQLGGMILHSPFMSGMRVLTPSRALACLDIYPNINRIRKVKCPVMVIHGRLDEEVDVSHGLGMHKAVPPQYQRDPWWVPNRGHNDITEGPGMLAEYVRRIRNFLASLDDD